MIFRIHLIDKLERERQGYRRASNGIYNRLAEAFNVPHHAVERICCRLRNQNQRYFKGIAAKHERARMRARRRKYGYDVAN